MHFPSQTSPITLIALPIKAAQLRRFTSNNLKNKLIKSKWFKTPEKKSSKISTKNAIPKEIRRI